MKNVCPLLFLLLLTTQLLAANDLAAKPPAPKIIRVCFFASGLNNGTSWADAFLELTDALNVAVEGDEIWVTFGIYFPTHGTDRNASFVLKNGVAIYGAFSGTESSVQQRTFNTGGTTLSGDIGTILDKNDNSYHVVKGENLNYVLLDYLVIESGNATGLSEKDKKGGGLYLTMLPNSPSLVSMYAVFIIRCAAATEGGGAYLLCKNGADCRLSLSSFSTSRNSAALGGCCFWDVSNAKLTIQSKGESYSYSRASDAGGGLYIRNAEKGVFDWQSEDVFVSQDTSTNRGGGMFVRSVDSSITKISWAGPNFLIPNLSGNQSQKGGGIYFETLNGSNMNFEAKNCQMRTNEVKGDNAEGGVISNHTESSTSKIAITNYRVAISDNKIIGASATANPRGAFLYNTGTNSSSTVFLSHYGISVSSNPNGSGGAIYNDDNNAQINLLHCGFDSSSVGKQGGDIYMNGGNLSIDSSSFSRSKAGGLGAAIYFQAQEGEHIIDIRNSRIDLSASAHSNIYLLASGTATIKPYFRMNVYQNNSNNESTGVGGSCITFKVNGRNAKISEGKVVQCAFRRNRGLAGAVLHEAIGGVCDVTYTNNLFLDNRSPLATVVNKVADTEGSCNVKFNNTLFWKNFDLNGGAGHTVVNQQDNTTPKPRPTFAHCLVTESDCSGLDQSICSNNLFGLDPLFADEMYETIYKLKPCSPVINAGNNDFVPSDLIRTGSDYGRALRIWQNTVDIGSDEYQGDNHEYSKILDTPNRTLFADKAYQDSSGWTHYYNCAEKTLIVSLKTDSTSMGRLTGDLKVSTTTTADYGIKAKALRRADYLANPQCDKWYVMNRFWQIKGANALTRPTEMRFYFSPKDSADLQKATPFSPYKDLLTYQVTKAAPQDLIVRGVNGTFKTWANGVRSSDTAWQLMPNTAAYRTSQFRITDVNSGGSAGVLVPANSLLTKVDTFLCANNPLKIAGRELQPGLTYLLKLTDTEGCDSSVQIKIETDIPPRKQGSVIQPDNGFNSGLIITNTFTNFTHRWSNGDTTAYNEHLKAGFYTDTIMTYHGCKDTFTFEVPLVLPYEMPNAFTPNGDGLNDLFAPVTPLLLKKPKIMSFKIVNRLGNIIYDNETPDTGWDGKYKTQDAASDVYVYFIELDFGNGHILRGSGEVNLIR